MKKAVRAVFLSFALWSSTLPGAGGCAAQPDLEAQEALAPPNLSAFSGRAQHAGQSPGGHEDSAPVDAPPVPAPHPERPTTRDVAPPTDPADAGAEGEDDSEATLFRQLDETFGRPGEVRDGVYRLVTPRTDLRVTVDGMDVPTGAFLESDFRFWRCPCGKLLVNGQFVLADYEVNDVIDELQTGRLHVAGVGPLLLHEQPRLMLVRFQGEGRARELAAALKSALGYTGEARHAPQPIDLAPRDE